MHACVYIMLYTYVHANYALHIVLWTQVKFIGEEALDQGSPKREYWRLLAIDIKMKLCIGSDDRLTLEHDVVGLQVSACIV